MFNSSVLSPKCNSPCIINFATKPCPSCDCPRIQCSMPKCDSPCRINYSTKPCPSCECPKRQCSVPKCVPPCSINPLPNLVQAALAQRFSVLSLDVNHLVQSIFYTRPCPSCQCPDIPKKKCDPNCK
ncbi:hypothetical protein CEXT_472441 [Caerostris extrusa]|uniref:Uncharacterized protein n=1 Tax=Caerostris extrusa TaxID=172846 RepID=A0AAV4X425_CAEEX|nr:hypothetical protein CEXT_472441 [Caerostris extrusa]